MTRRIMCLGFLLRLLVAVWNGFFGPSFGADGDANGLHAMAVDYMHGTSSPIFRLPYLYAYALGTLYKVTTPSLFLGCLLSCLAWLASAQTLLAIMELLAVRRTAQAKAMLIYAVLPSAVLWTAVTLREPYQLLFVNLSVYASLKIYVSRSARHWPVLLGACAIGGVLHGSLFGSGLFVITATIASLVFRKRHLITGRMVAVAVPLGLLLVWVGYQSFMRMYSYPVDQGLAYAVESYQRGGLSIGVRTDYRTTVAIDSTLDLLLFLPVCLLQYLFEPMPWHITSLADVEPFFENSLRGILLWKALTGIHRMPFRPRRAVLLVFLPYLVLETAWSLGTFNWGTATRHHIPAMGLLLAAAFAHPARQSDRHRKTPVTGLVHAAA